MTLFFSFVMQFFKFIPGRCGVNISVVVNIPINNKVSHDYNDFVNPQDLLAQCLKVLIGQMCVYVYKHLCLHRIKKHKLIAFLNTYPLSEKKTCGDKEINVCFQVILLYVLFSHLPQKKTTKLLGNMCYITKWMYKLHFFKANDI